MELAQLKYFLTVANCGQIAQASMLLYVSQSAISMSISRLEKELGVELFERKGRSIRLTQNGVSFMDMITPAMAELDFAKNQIMAIDGMEPDVVSLSVEAPDFATNFERVYCGLNPNVRFRQSMDTTEVTRQKLMCKTVDFALTFEPFSEPEVSSICLISEPALVQLSCDNPLSKSEGVWLAELKDTPFVSFSSEYSFRRWTDGICFLAGFRPQMCFEVCDTQSLMSIVHSSNAATFIGKSTWVENVPEAAHPTINDGHVRAIPVYDRHCKRNMYLSCHKSRILSPAAQEFLCYASRFQRAMKQFFDFGRVGKYLAENLDEAVAELAEGEDTSIFVR